MHSLQTFLNSQVTQFRIFAVDPIGTISQPSGFVQGNPNAVIKNLIGGLFGVIVVAAVVYLMLAGYTYVSAQGDPAKLKQASAMLTNTILGLIIAFAAYFVVIVLLKMLGVGDIPAIPGT